MNRNRAVMTIAVMAAVSAGAAFACDEARVTTSARGPLLAEALSELHAGRGRQLPAAARAALAQWRSEIETARAQSASTPAGPSIRTGR